MLLLNLWGYFKELQIYDICLCSPKIFINMKDGGWEMVSKRKLGIENREIENSVFIR